ncbi:MAG: hypothetical protein R3253_08065 [Longimicrobiales bacterium]|nr:hypothetical protein [Longimicrobiales bacterium]
MLTLEEMWALARIWYRGRMDPDWRGRSVDDSRSILTEVGLEDDFWSLPG